MNSQTSGPLDPPRTARSRPRPGRSVGATRAELKVDPQLRLTRTIPDLSGSVWCDLHHRRTLGLQMLGPRSSIRETPRSSSGACPDVVLTTRPDQLAVALDALRRTDPAHSLHLITSSTETHVLKNLQSPTFGRDLALRAFALDRGLIHLELTRARDADSPAGPLFQGILIGQALTDRPTDHRAAERSLSERLALTLRHAAELDRTLAASARSSSAEIARLQAQITSHEALLEKKDARYKALSESTLGRATITYWTWRKKFRR